MKIYKNNIWVLLMCFVVLGVGFFVATASAQESVSGNTTEILKTIGLPQASDFDVAKIVACTIFGAIGLGAFIYGKKNAFWKPMAIGIVLMAYPYFVSGALPLYLIGCVLTIGLFFWR